MPNIDRSFEPAVKICRICHAPRQAPEEAGDVTGCGWLVRIIVLPIPPPPLAYAYRRNSPSSLWEAVKKYHYACAESSRFAYHSKVNRLRLSLGLCHHRAALFAAPPHGDCTCNIVYSIIKFQERSQTSSSHIPVTKKTVELTPIKNFVSDTVPFAADHGQWNCLRQRC